MNPPAAPLVRAAGGVFAAGYTPILSRAAGDFDFDFGIQVLGEDTLHFEVDRRESLWVLLHGAATIQWNGSSAPVQRTSLFDEPPHVLHLGPGSALRIETHAGGSEWAVAHTANDRVFEPRYIPPEAVALERRGAGLVRGTCERHVRLVFDRSSRPESNFVVGEVVNFPGRWSSYPPHHHAQPEIYHYRFTHPQGYGHAEVGQDVFRAGHGDTLRIPGGRTHAQVAAPGYGMYYLWIVHHLEDAPYSGFEYLPEHTWILDPAEQGWEPRR